MATPDTASAQEEEEEGEGEGKEGGGVGEVGRRSDSLSFLFLPPNGNGSEDGSSRTTQSQTDDGGGTGGASSGLAIHKSGATRDSDNSAPGLTLQGVAPRTGGADTEGGHTDEGERDLSSFAAFSRSRDDDDDGGGLGGGVSAVGSVHSMVGKGSGGGEGEGGGEEHRETTHNNSAHALMYADGPVGGDLSREVLVESDEGEEEEDGYVHVG